MISRTFKAVSTLGRDRGARRLQPVAVWLLALLVSAQSCETTRTTGAPATTRSTAVVSDSTAIETCFDLKTAVSRRIEACHRASEAGAIRESAVIGYLQNRARQYREDGATGAAEDDYSTIIGYAPAPYLITGRGRARLAAGDYAGAAADFREVELANPRQSPDNMLGLALANAGLGRYDDALAELGYAANSQRLRRDRRFVEAYATVLFARGDNLKADNRTAFSRFEIVDFLGDKTRFNRLWRYFAQAHRGIGDPNVLLLTEFGATFSMTPGEAARVVLGARPQAGRTRATHEALAKWLFFSGQAALLDGDTAQAAAYFNEAEALNLHDSLVHIAALAELRKLAGE